MENILSPLIHLSPQEMDASTKKFEDFKQRSPMFARAFGVADISYGEWRSILLHRFMGITVNNTTPKE